MPSGAAPTVVALSTNMMDRSRFGSGTKLTKSADELRQALTAPTPPALALVDLTVDGAIEALAAATSGTRVVAFAPHVAKDVLAAAGTNPAIEAMPRSKFFGQLGELLGNPDSGNPTQL